jgi:hypothetical protein
MSMLLKPYDAIAWDIDGTLIGGGNSAYLRNFIHQHPEKRHHVVTFRTGDDWIAHTRVELSRYDLGPDVISSISHVPDAYYHAYAQAAEFPDDERIDLFYLWKGREAARLGCGVLVDDLPALVLPGCRHYGVAFVDANDPAIWDA